MWSGTIGDSADGDLSRRGRGRIPARRFSVEGDHSQSLEVINEPADSVSSVRLTVIREVPGHRFDRCPICLAPEAGSEEHVPPRALGGQPRTWTCAACNNGLGRLEADLVDWRDDALRSTRVTADALLGARRLPRLLRRRTPDGQFVLIIDGPMHPDAEPLLKGPNFTLEFTPPDPRRYKLAAMKQAYLAACLDLASIPATPCAEVIRRDLLAARNAPSRSDTPVSDYALSMPLMRTHEQPQGPSIALSHFSRPDGLAEFWILLAGTIAVPWPLPDRPPVV